VEEVMEGVGKKVKTRSIPVVYRGQSRLDEKTITAE